MSGVKTGSVSPSSIVAPLAVGVVAVAGAGVVAIGGAVCAGVAGSIALGSAVCTGVARATRECSEKVNEYTESVIREEIANISANLDKHKSNLEDLLKKQPDSTFNRSRFSELVAARENREAERYRKIVVALSQVKDERKKYEKSKGLDPAISRRIEQQIAEIRKQQEQKEKDADARREAAKSSGIDQKTLALHQRVREMLEAVQDFYPDVCGKVEADLDRCERTGTLNLRALETIGRKYNLEPRAQAVNKYSEKLKKLTGIRLEYEKIRYRDGREYEEFLKRFSSARDRAEKGMGIEDQIENLQEILLQHSEQSTQRESQSLHKMSCEQAKNSLVKCGYTTIKTTHNNRYRIMEGTAEDGRKATVKLALPGQADADIDPIRTEIDQSFYREDQEVEYNAAGQELVLKLESEGMMVDFSEASIEYKGRWASHAEQVLKDQARSLGYSDEQVNSIQRIDERRISINGRASECPATVNVRDFLRHSFDAGMAAEVSEVERQRERV